MEEMVKLEVPQDLARALRSILEDESERLENRTSVPQGQTLAESWERIQVSRGVSEDISNQLTSIEAAHTHRQMTEASPHGTE